ncbi:MAG: ABC transporter ATP-binding protein [Clostridia bacterium]|nr:ABC transporter ATP-binding protein [Clostridia bacterium]
MNGMSLLEVKDLTIYFEKNESTAKAVNGISFSLEEGQTLGLVGETGAGKTTTALGIMNLVPNPPGKIKKGEIKVDGRDVLKMSKRELQKYRGRDVAMIFQDPMTSLNPVVRVGDQIAEILRHHKKLSRAQAAVEARDMLKLVGIGEERLNDYPHQFSGGMKQRVMIAIALACRPRILLADEPTTALDVTIQAQILELMNDLKREMNTAMILITHDLGVVAEVCDRVAIMYAGHIVEAGSLEQVFNHPLHPYTVGLFKSIPKLDDDSERLEPIHGMMPDPARLPEGCKFCDRCPRRQEYCKSILPRIVEMEQGHQVMCHLYDGWNQEA